MNTFVSSGEWAHMAEYPTEVRLPEYYAFTDQVHPVSLARMATRNGWKTSAAIFQRGRQSLRAERLTNAEFGVVFDKRQLVGFGRIAFSGVQGDLSWLLVDSDYRHEGIAKAIIDARLQLANKVGVETLHIDALDPTNILRSYYLEKGFEQNEQGELVLGLNSPSLNSGR